MKPSPPQPNQTLYGRWCVAALLQAMVLWALPNALFAQERILKLDATAATAALTPDKGSEPPIRLLSKGNKRADFESAAAWARATVVRLNHEEYTALELPGGGTSGEFGEPALPSYGKFIQVPDGAKVRLVIDKVDWTTIEGMFTVAPRQPPPPDLAGAAAPPFAKKPEAYARDEFHPAEPVRLTDQMRIRRQAMVYVVYTPLAYNPAKGMLKAARRVEWHLEFDLVEKQKRSSKPDATGQREFAPVTQGALDARPESAEAPAPGADLATGNGADYLIITHDSFHTSILPLANWKHAKGYRTRVVKLSEISPNPTCTNITAYIQNAYNTWNPAPTYVLLVGDSAYLPAWYKTYHSYYGAYSASDLWYSTVDGSDYFPDLFLGRLPCASTAQCDLMVNKVLSVEKTPHPTAAMYQTLLTAGQFTDSGGGYEERIFIETAEAVRDFHAVLGYTVPTAYCSDTSTTPRHYNSSESLLHSNGALYGGTQTYVTTSAGTAAITNAINSGVWLVQHRDHGSQTGGWATPPFSPSRASALTNSNKLPVIMSINCETAWFDGASDSLAEALVKNPNGGSHCVIGATRVSYSWHNDWFTLGLFECMYTNFFETLSAIPYYKPNLSYGNNMAGHGTHIGQMLNFAKMLMYEKEGAGSVTQIEFDILALLGDPEQSPRTAVPQVLSAVHPSRLMADVPTSFDVAVRLGGTLVGGALVALVLDPGDYHTAISDGSGVAHFSFTPSAPVSNSLMRVTVSHQNGIPYDGVLTIDTSRLTVTVPASGREGDGVLAGQGLVTVSPTPTNSVTVTLSSSDASEATVPASVVVPSGQTNANFNVTIVDDVELDGTQTVFVEASATGYASATNVIAVADNESATLQVVLPASVSEGGGTVQGAVHVSAAPAASVAMNLSSSDTTEIQVPASVLIPAGQTSAVFTATLVDEALVDGPQTATVTAHVPYWTEGSAAVTVLDNEPLTLTVTLPPSAYESAGLVANAGTVCLAGTAVANLTVVLGSSDLTELSVPASITITSGQSCASFSLMMADDVLVDGIQMVTVTASAPGFTNGTASLSVLDDESPPVPSNPSPANLATNVLATADLAWQSGAVSGQIITNEVFLGTNPAPGPADLLGSTTNTSWALPQLAPLTTYYWQVVAHRVGVTPGPVWQFTTKGVDHFDWSAITTPQPVGTPFPVTITARDAFNAVVSNYTSAVSLSGVRLGSPSSPVVITEIDPNTPDFIEFMNVSANAMEVSGWHITLYDYDTYPNSSINFTTPASTVVPAGGVFRLIEFGTAPGTYPAFYTGDNINWTASTSAPVAVLLRDASGVVIDFACVGSAVSTAITSPVAIPTNQWSGSSIPGTSTGANNYQRVGNQDHNNITDWLTATGSPGMTNAGLIVPFAGSSAVVTITPTNSGNFVSGVWSSSLTVLEPATNMCLVATDGSSHRGTSTNFDVLLANDLSVAVVDQPDPVAVGGYVTNLITVVNSGPAAATGVTATNFLPASVAFVSATVSQGASVLVGSRVDCDLGTLAGGVAATVAVVTTPGAAGQISNLVTAGRAEADAYAGNNSAVSVTTVLLPVLSITDVSVLEGNSGQTDLAFAVRLSLPAPLAVTVNFATADGSAQGGTDYVLTNGVLSFAPGQTNGTVTVRVLGDTNAEPNETLFVNLAGAVNAGLGDTQGIGTILNDEVPPYVYLRSTVGAPWSSTANEAAMSRALGTNNWQDLRFETVNPAALLNPASQFIFMEGSDKGALEMQTFLTANLPAIENWVTAGGRLFLNAAPNEGSGMSFGFGVSLLYSSPATSSTAASAAAPLHPVFQGPFTPVGTSWAGTSFGHATVSGTNLTTLITNTANGQAVLGELAFGSGVVLFGGMTTPNFHTPITEAANLRDNILAYSANFTSCSNCPPVILAQPANQTVRPGANVTFCVPASGSPPLSYQWSKDGTNLVDGGRITGATMGCLRIATAVEADSGQYSVAITNAYGYATTNLTLLVSALDHFAWDAIPSPQLVNAPFAAGITARDATNGLVAGFNGCVALSSVAASTNTIGTNTSTVNFPLGTGYHDERTQVIYQPGEIGGAGRITALSLDVATVPSQTMNLWTVRMKHTPLTGYTSYLWEATGWTTVYQASLYVTATGWITFVFTTPFDYNGVDGLMIDFSFNNSSYTSDGYCRSTSRTGIRSLYYRTDSGYGDPRNWTGSTPTPYTSSYTPNLRLALGGGPSAPIQPAVACFTNGVWTEPLVVQALATNLVLRADDGSGQFGLSNPFDVVPSNQPPVITTQPANQIVAVGGEATFNVRVYGTPPLSYQWRKDGAEVAGATASSLFLSNVQAGDVGTYTVLVTNLFGSATSSNALLTFQTYADLFNPAPSGSVYATAVQPDGRILVGGNFTTLGGQSRYYLGRLNADGSLDISFNPGASSSVYCLAVQPDGRILVGGGFTTLAGQTRHCLGRLNADGSLDTSFNPGASSSVYCLAVQPDGRILVGGGFTTLADQTRYYLGRLNTDGSLDTGFNPGAGSYVYGLAMQPDGKILVGGGFTTLAGQTRYYLGRLNVDGTLDTGFNPGAGSSVYCLAVQPDGRILVGGSFATLASQTRYYLGRLNTEGSLDTGFNPAPGSSVYSLVLQADGGILAGGAFSTLAGQLCNYLGRLKPDGSLDAGCISGANSSVYSLAVQPDGRILAGGSFTTLGGQTRNYLGRLYNTVPATESLTSDGSNVTWLRGGASPEVWCATLDGSTNGTQWGNLGAGIRIAGGWQWPGIGVASNATLRAQGFVAGGEYNGSGSLVETMSGPVFIAAQPAGRTSNSGSAATFSVVAGGASPLSYQWRKHEVNLGDGRNISGAQTANLTLTNLLWGDAGAYSVVVSNAFGSVTSHVAVLTVLDPGIASPPASRTNNCGTLATFSVITVGTSPFNYQWRKDGVNLSDGGNVSGSQTVTLSLSPVWGADAGGYSVVVSNVYGNVTSHVATLAVGDPLITGQPVSQSANQGQTALFNVSANGTAPLDYQWRRGGADLAGATTALLTLTNIQRADAAAYDVRVSNAFGGVTSVLATLTVNLATNDPFNPGPNNTVNALAVQADGKVLVGGSFSMLGGQTRSYLGRLHSDGSLDTAFNPGASGVVNALAVQMDGRILVGGSFSTLGGLSRYNLGRLNTNGTLDTTFNPNPGSAVYSLALQPDGKIVAGGSFTSLGGLSRYYLGRLNTNGTLDTTFNPNPSGAVYSLALQPDGKIVAGGGFTSLGGQPRYYLGRLNDDGSLNTTFNPGAYSTVYSLAIQADGRILAGGTFTTLAGQPRNRIGRLNADGTLDPLFNPNASGTVYSLALQSDGKILAAGAFTTLGGLPCSYLGRVNTDGSLDSAFNPGASAQVSSLALQADGKILVGGNFTTLAGQGRSRLGRLNNTDAVSQNLASIFGGWSIVWTRSGAGPEVWRASFDVTTDSTNWVSLGDADRFSGGWQLSGLNLPACANIRARGFASGGQYNGSSWFVESVVGPPIITCHPGCQTNDVGTTATFNVTAVGPAPLTYQWCKGDLTVNNGANLCGAQTSALTLSNLLTGDAGAYSVVVSNPWGSVTSLVATLAVQVPQTPPAILVNDGVFGVHSNRFGFNVRAVPGQVVVIEASTNLVSWTPIQTNLVNGAVIFFTDPQSPLFARRFYRARLHQGALPPPAVMVGDGALGFQGGRFGFNLAGVAGQSVVIEGSTNLVNWIVLATNTLGTDPLWFSDPGSANAPCRFYRARLP